MTGCNYRKGARPRWRRAYVNEEAYQAFSDYVRKRKVPHVTTRSRRALEIACRPARRPTRNAGWRCSQRPGAIRPASARPGRWPLSRGKTRTANEESAGHRLLCGRHTASIARMLGITTSRPQNRQRFAQPCDRRGHFWVDLPSATALENANGKRRQDIHAWFDSVKAPPKPCWFAAR